MILYVPLKRVGQVCLRQEAQVVVGCSSVGMSVLLLSEVCVCASVDYLAMR